MRRANLVAGVVAAVGALGACDRQPPSAELFPLEPGHRWTYRQTLELDDGSREVTKLELSTLPSEPYEGATAWRRRSADGNDWWLRRDASGIYRVAAKHDQQAEPQPDAQPRYVLKEPLAAGTEWPAPTLPYLLKRRQGFPPELRHDHPSVPMRYAIAALDETVTVPAGRWERCLRVRGEAAVRLYADGMSGWKDVPLVTTEWYCPGPGLVKLERNETVSSPFLTGGRLTLELQAWRTP
ncbi:MAG TPA: hypothetical protein VFR90_04250 [Methylibium sp.]|uniref:hypothetical protein n=1 Tax=Methylibium sp. TaxID=2067992 RepID=UPI002DBDECCE|nr:hypothetical protein [Methylibium sp.]HEU4458312.1 hypothetical protein [Methylibium sp.]